MSDKNKRQIIEALAASLEISDTAYEKAERRYKDLAEWFKRPESACSKFDPHIYPQGSFRLGTVVGRKEYDLDFGCRLRFGVTKTSHTQEQLKELVRQDLEAYRKARGIKNELQEKTRCWRLAYADELSFHMDAVPSIPEEEARRQILFEEMVKFGSANNDLASDISKFAGAITDKDHPNFKRICADWRISNSEGYARWFRSRMKLATALMEKRAYHFSKATIDELPERQWKSPLQKAIQILKHHRDEMYADNEDAQPISVIITTLAAEAYQGEEDVSSALERILTDMDKYLLEMKPRVPNPVNPVEDFADKWYDPKFRHLNLEENFRTWLRRARADFKLISESRDIQFIAEQGRVKFGAAMDEVKLASEIGFATAIASPKIHLINESPAKPWAC